MKITKVKFADDKVTVKWDDDGDTSQRKTEFSCYDKPRESFEEAFATLGPVALDLIGASESQRAGANVSGISITHEEERIGVVITLLIDTDGKTKGPLVMNTPYLVDDDDNGPEMNGPMRDAVYDIIKEAAKYVRGDRAQKDMFVDGETEAA